MTTIHAQNPAASRARTAARCCAWLAAPALLLVMGCMTPPTVATTDGTFHDSLRTYSNLVRWGEIDSASRFVHKDQREDFLALSSDLEQVRFTDFDMGPVRFGEQGAWARVKVVYHVYDIRTLVEQRIVDEQVWFSESRSEWTVWPDLASFQETLGITIEDNELPPIPAPAKAAFGLEDESDGDPSDE